MSKKNYSKMYSAEEEKVAHAEEVIEAPAPVAAEEIPVQQKAPEKIKATVVDCVKLNVREHPSVDAAVLAVISVSSEVRVAANEKYDEWYHVFTEAGIEGFCMKKYIAIEK